MDTARGRMKEMYIIIKRSLPAGSKKDDVEEF